MDRLSQTARLEGIARVVGLPDLHAGRGIAVGAAFWSRDHVYPHLVGSDIGCGMGLWRTGIPLRKFRLDAAGRKLRGLEQPWAGDHAGRLAEAGLPPDLAGEALGTIGGGNPFAELLRVETHGDTDVDPTALYLMVHSGSRGLGQAILERHLAGHNVAGLIAGEAACDRYLAAHNDAVAWAVCNRALIAERFLHRLGATGERVLDICHNSVTPHGGGARRRRTVGWWSFPDHAAT